MICAKTRRPTGHFSAKATPALLLESPPIQRTLFPPWGIAAEAGMHHYLGLCDCLLDWILPVSFHVGLPTVSTKYTIEDGNQKTTILTTPEQTQFATSAYPLPIKSLETQMHQKVKAAVASAHNCPTTCGRKSTERVPRATNPPSRIGPLR